MKKRLLSAALVLLLILTLLPTGVLATDEPWDGSSKTTPQEVGGVYQIGTAAELAWFRDYVNQTVACDASAILTANIDLNNQSWTPISTQSTVANKYKGTFNGQFYTISGLSVSGTIANQGLFADINGATIKNLMVEGSVTSTNNYVGGIVGTARNATIENCSFSGSVTYTGTGTSQYIGGIVGGIQTTASTIKNCVNMANVTGYTAGGILGYTTTNSTIENCYNTGTVTGSNRSGGIVGQATTGTIKNCYNIGIITGSSTTPGGIYSFFNGTMTNCYHLYPASEAPGGSSINRSIKIDSADGLLVNLDSNAFVANTDGINDGYPLLYWQTPPDTTPSISLSGETTIYVQESTGVHFTTLTISKKNIDDLDVEDVDWNIEKKGGGSANQIAVLETVSNDTESIIVSAAGGGVVTVTATVTAAGNEYVATRHISVIPKITTAEIVNVNTPGAVAMGQTVQVKVNVLGGGEYDYDNFPKLTYQWRYNSTLASANIVGATTRTFEIPTDAGYTEWAYVYVEIKSGGVVVKEADDVRGQLRSEAYGKLYPVATTFPLPSNIKDGADLTLPPTYTMGDVTAGIAWDSNAPSVIDTESGAVTRPESGTTTVRLTARFTYGTAFANRNFDIVIWSQAAVDAEASDNEADLQEARDALGSWYKLYPVYGDDTNVADMVTADLSAKGYGDISVSVKNAVEVYGDCNIDDNGKISYFYADPNGSRGTWFGRYDASFTLTKGDASVELTNVPVTIYWDVNKVKDTLAAEIIDKVTMNTVLAENSSKDAVTTNLTLPKVVDNKKWALISWTSSDPSAIVISSENQTTADMLFNPYVGKVIRGATDKTVTLTAAFTFQRANDLIGSEPPIVVYKTFTIEVKALDGEDAETARAALLAKLDAGFTAKGLRDYVTGTKLTEKDGAYTAANDIQFPTTGDYGVDGKYYPVLITSSDEEVIATSGINNAARVSVYRPLPGQPAKEVTLTVTIVDTTNGISASKEFTIFVQPLTQDEIDAELVLMEQVKTHYFEGIKNANAAADQITGNLHAFQEAYLKDGELTFVYDYKNLVNHGIVPVAMDGWYDLQVWRLFKSSNPAVISHENLLVTRAENAKAVTITSALSSEIYGKYGERYEQDPEKYAGYAPLAGLYKQNVSIDLIVRGTKNPASAQPVVETLSVSFTLQSADSTWLTKTPISGLAEGSTVFDLFKKVLQDNGYTYHARGSYIDAITTPQGKTISELDTGANSGWMYKVNGTISSAYMAAHALKNGDNVVVFFTRDYTVETGYPGGGWNQPVPSPTVGAKVVSNGDGTYSATIDTQKTPAPGGVLVSIPNVPKGAVLVIVNADGTETIVKKSVILDGTAYLLLNQSATIKVREASANFSDVTPGDWYRDAVAFAAGHQLFRGTSDSTFSPNTPMTRAMLVTVLYRLEDASAGQSSGFADVAAGAWYADATSWAAAQGIVKGLGNGSFVPDQDISRQQLVTILYRYAAVLDLDTSGRANLSAFSDNAGVAEYAGTPMAWAVEAGLIQGYNGTLSPEAPASRAEVAVILYRLMELIVQ